MYGNSIDQGAHAYLAKVIFDNIAKEINKAKDKRVNEIILPKESHRFVILDFSKNGNTAGKSQTEEVKHLPAVSDLRPEDDYLPEE